MAEPLFTVSKVVPRGSWSHSALKPTAAISCALCQRNVYEPATQFKGVVKVHSDGCGGVCHLERAVAPGQEVSVCPVCHKTFSSAKLTELNVWQQE